MERAFANVLTDDVDRTCRFYEELLGLKRTGDFGWFCLLGSDAMPTYELGVLDRTHETVPTLGASAPAGVILTFVIGDVQAAFAKAKEMQAEIVEPPKALPYGQTRLLLRDPAGTLVDISAPTR